MDTHYHMVTIGTRQDGSRFEQQSKGMAAESAAYACAQRFLDDLNYAGQLTVIEPCESVDCTVEKE